MTEESPQVASQEPQSKHQRRELYLRVQRALLDAPGGRARKRRALRRARGRGQRLDALAEQAGESVSLHDS